MQLLCFEGLFVWCSYTDSFTLKRDSCCNIIKDNRLAWKLIWQCYHNSPPKNNQAALTYYIEIIFAILEYLFSWIFFAARYILPCFRCFGWLHLKLRIRTMFATNDGINKTRQTTKATKYSVWFLHEADSLVCL